MKLYCVKMFLDDVITDVFTIVEKDDKAVYKRVEQFMRDCENVLIDERYDSFSFSEISCVDDYEIVVGDRLEEAIWE